MNLWMYWEGPKNAWIEACLEIVRAHHPEVRLIGPEEWDEMWVDDRDMDLDRFAIMHKADFIRGYLLSRYGGLWLDADCILQQRLDWILEGCKRFDLVGYRFRPLMKGRAGRWSNALMGGRPGSRILEAYYQNVRDGLKKRKWRTRLAFGPNMLTKAVREHHYPGSGTFVLDIPRWYIHPHLWYNKTAQWAERSDEEHARHHKPDLFMYMVTHTTFSLKQMTPEQVWNSRMMISYMLRRGRDNALASQK